MESLYITDRELFSKLAKERDLDKGITWDTLVLINLKKSWFSLIESTGGGAKPNFNSEKSEEVALALIEKSIELLTTK